MRTPHKVVITISTENEAFDDCEHGEIARILRTLARAIGDGSQSLDMPADQVCMDNEIGGTGKRLFDTNGNTIGHIIASRIT